MTYSNVLQGCSDNKSCIQERYVDDEMRVFLSERLGSERIYNQIYRAHHRSTVLFTISRITRGFSRAVSQRMVSINFQSSMNER